jgi:hypothetical protein
LRRTVVTVAVEMPASALATLGSRDTGGSLLQERR